MIGKRERFISWMCPILKIKVTAPKECIFYENDLLDDVYFLKSGSCNYVLPRYSNHPFLRITEYTTFGHVDFVAALLSKT